MGNRPRSFSYYNEIDPFAASWLENLIDAGYIQDGIVDRRSILDVDPADLSDFTQCHFFAGIGGWSWALRLADWPDDKPVWTGSCPCQPFSTAGKGKGVKDDRHLWPYFSYLIGECRPPVVFGEQVASPLGRDWLATVRADLEEDGYEVGAADLCAAGVGAPHIRQRLYWGAVAKTERESRGTGDAQRNVTGGHTRAGVGEKSREEVRDVGDGVGASGAVGNSRMAVSDGRNSSAKRQQRSGEQRQQQKDSSVGSRLAHSHSERRSVSPQRHSEPLTELEPPQRHDPSRRYGLGGTNATNFVWKDPDWLFCRDNNWRPVEPGTFPLVTGIPQRVGQLRGYGNAIVPPLAAEFISAFMEAVDDNG